MQTSKLKRIALTKFLIVLLSEKFKVVISIKDACTYICTYILHIRTNTFILSIVSVVEGMET